MTIIRVADIPRDELDLLPVADLRRQIREDRRVSAADNGSAAREKIRRLQGALSRLRRGRQLAGARVAWPATVGGFFTDWQLRSEPRPSSRAGFDEGQNFDAGEGHDTDEGLNLTALYVDIGGEG